MHGKHVKAQEISEQKGPERKGGLDPLVATRGPSRSESLASKPGLAVFGNACVLKRTILMIRASPPKPKERYAEHLGLKYAVLATV